MMTPRQQDTRAARTRFAAPAGGARSRGRGCVLTALMLLPAAPALSQTDIAVPSGQVVTLREILIDEVPGAPWLRFRFLAPAIARDGGTVAPVAAAEDMDHLCREIAAPYAEAQGLMPERIVISLSDRDLAFGETNPDATQFFDVFRLEDGLCIWEEF